MDFVVTYEPPSKLHDFLDQNSGDRNHINTYLNDVYEKISFERWFFGKLHLNKLIPPKYYAVYDQIVIADETRIKKKREPKHPKNTDKEN